MVYNPNGQNGLALIPVTPSIITNAKGPSECATRYARIHQNTMVEPIVERVQK